MVQNKIQKYLKFVRLIVKLVTFKNIPYET
jgi:hypothetical protein